MYWAIELSIKYNLLLMKSNGLLYLGFSVYVIFPFLGKFWLQTNDEKYPYDGERHNNTPNLQILIQDFETT